MIIAITGPPRSGKTTLAETLSQQGDYVVVHLDDWIKDYSWSGLSQAAADFIYGWRKYPDSHKGVDLIIEGVQVPRALRKCLVSEWGVRPVDKVIYINEPKVELTKKQESMGKGVKTVFSSIKAELESLGVEIDDDSY